MSSESNPGMLSSTSRKALKQNCMNMENQDFHSYIQDLEKTLSLNKQVLADLILTKIPSNDSSNIVIQLLQEVKNMEDLYLKKVKDCEDNQAKALMDEQISTEYFRKEQEFIAESEEKIADIIYQNDKKSKVISELSIRIRQFEEDSELYKKSRNMVVVPPTEDIIDLHSRVEDLKQILSYEARHLYSLQSKRERLSQNSEMLKKEVNKMKILLKNPMNRKYGIERTNSNGKSDLSMEIIKQDDESEEDSDENIQPMPITIGTGKSKSEPLFELSLNRQHTLSFDILTLSCREEDEKVLNDINEHIETMKTEIQKITEELVRVSRENENLYDNNEKLAKNYLRSHDYIDISQTTERKAITKSKYSKSNSNIADEVFKFVDANYLSPRIP